jgi:hypothetical protein
MQSRYRSPAGLHRDSATPVSIIFKSVYPSGGTMTSFALPRAARRSMPERWNWRGLGAAGTGAITFEAGAQTLRIDQAALDHGHLQNTINGFGAGDTIDLAVRPTSRRIAAEATIWCWTSAKATAATRPSCSITSGKLSQRPRTGTSSPET